MKGFNLPISGVQKVKKNPDYFFGGWLVTLDNGDIHNVYCEGGVWRHASPKKEGPQNTYLASCKAEVLAALVIRQAEFNPQK